ncbi:hypothetical protein PR048_030300 [Dryococelus australis]|uniref:Integrase catalytic domain-containing protein n=1 Tax=Dryococelus australis TaxID=614101 RepID=A0ABQ9G8L2_9NEOP|nr:hypothetical protein PR048_030300 [Dryococelus australis]
MGIERRQSPEIHHNDDRQRYFVTFLDDYTHFSVTCLIKNKSDVCDAARNYIVEAESKWNSRVYKLRCDIWGECVANEFTDWCRERGINIDYVPAAIAQLIGRTERLNGTLMEKTRSLIFDSGVEKEFWGDALRTATYLLNRSPSATVDTTPAKIWYGKRPALANLKLFGSLAYATKFKKLGKLDKRRDKLIMVGYATNGHRLWNSGKREIKLSRDVTFVKSTEVPATNNLSQKIIADTDTYYVMLSYKESIYHEDKDKWLKAIEEEKSSLKKNGVFQFVDDDNRYKARLVVRGCEQKAGLDYSETFSSMVLLNNLRFLIAYAKTENVSLKQFDIKTAFLYGNLEQDVFMLVPEGFEDEQGSVVKLKKSLYGLKQVPRPWSKRFVDFLKAHGLHQLIKDMSIFVNDEGNLILAIWVDDGLVISNENDKIDEFMMKLQTEFEGTRNLGLRYSTDLNTSLIDAYSDADYASDETSRRTDPCVANVVLPAMCCVLLYFVFVPLQFVQRVVTFYFAFSIGYVDRCLTEA